MRRLLFVVALVAVAGTATVEAQAPGATAELRNAQGAVVGSATFGQGAGGVAISASVRGLPPGPHGIHVHQTGRCEGPDFASAGGHFNPAGRQHGLKNAQGSHAGDLPNLVVGANGTGTIEATAVGATLEAGAASLLDADGAALVVHAGPDDELTDPAGNSGGRIACGVLAQRAVTQLPRTGGPGASLPLLAAGALLVGGAAARRRRH